jgi:hypothetical protein
LSVSERLFIVLLHARGWEMFLKSTAKRIQIVVITRAIYEARNLRREQEEKCVVTHKKRTQEHASSHVK